MFVDCLILPFFDNSTQLNSRIVHSKMYQMNVLARQLYSSCTMYRASPTPLFRGDRKTKKRYCPREGEGEVRA
jgi:hypothetical protein